MNQQSFLKGVLAAVQQKGEQWWQQLKNWLSAQPRWRLALYGIGGPLLAGILVVTVLAMLVWQGAFGALPTYGDLKNIHNNQASEIYSKNTAL